MTNFIWLTEGGTLTLKEHHESQQNEDGQSRSPAVTPHTCHTTVSYRDGARMVSECHQLSANKCQAGRPRRLPHPDSSSSQPAALRAAARRSAGTEARSQPPAHRASHRRNSGSSSSSQLRSEDASPCQQRDYKSRLIGRYGCSGPTHFAPVMGTQRGPGSRGGGRGDERPNAEQKTRTPRI